MDSVVTLAQRLTQIAQPDTAFQLVSLRAHDCRVDSYGEAAVANCYVSQTGRLRGERSRTEALATIVYVRQGEGWKIASSHLSPVGPQR